MDDIARIEDLEERRQLAILYFAHEVVHHAQGMKGLETVRRLRSAGGETTLMHVDLAADHVAAGITARVFPQWTLQALKDREGRSLGAYPVGWMHPNAARARKAVR